MTCQIYVKLMISEMMRNAINKISVKSAIQVIFNSWLKFCEMVPKILV